MNNEFRIDKHPNFQDLLDYLRRVGSYTKKDLVDMLNDKIYETKKDLRAKTKGDLLELAVDSEFDPTLE